MYKQLRDTSDRICLEHGLSVIKEPKGRSVGSYLYKMERAGMPTRYNVARQAIDESIALSLTLEEFKSELRKRGYNYRFDPNRKYWMSRKLLTATGYLRSMGTEQELLQQKVKKTAISHGLLPMTVSRPREI
jgi:hypothetical protein